MKTRTPHQSGKLGNIVASRNRHGSYHRAYVPPSKPPTPAQLLCQSGFADISDLWNDLTDDERRDWNAEPARHGSTLTGQNLFISINSDRRTAGLSLLRRPPPEAPLLPNPVRELRITWSRGRLRILLAVDPLPSEHILVAASKPCNPEVSVCFMFRTLGLLPTPVNGFSDITELYAARHGLPAPGQRIFIKTRHLENYYSNLFKTCTARVPEPRAPRPRRRPAPKRLSK